MDQIPITTQGFEALKKELERLKTIERPENIKAIEVARAHGDLSENAEYHAAKERQSFLEGRIGEISYKVGNAKIIDPETVPKDVVRFASRVLVENLDSEEEIEYMIVGADEADIKKGKISSSSPLGSALIGKEPGEEAVVHAPGGKRIYEIIDIL
ncbi:MAG: transcription elongation factor GreA [Desulfobacter sp.]|nr:transcription elongation factor GreA [Desulfobacter sp.]WDP85940.1 MAG: transcription elongation factor GreA [Desulfobacter sp.]